MTLDEVKIFLRIDGTDENDLLNTLMQTAEYYVEDSIIDYASKKDNARFIAKADLLKLMVVNDMYSDRSTVAGNEKYRLIYQSLITQLSYGTYS